MQASSETLVAIRSDGSRRFLRQLLPAWKQANAETTSRDPVFAAALGQESDLRLRLHASKAEERRQPLPGHLRGRRGNDEAPFLDHLEPGRSLQPPMRHSALLGPLPRHVPHSLPARQCARLPDKRPPNPTSTAPRKESNVLRSDSWK